MDQRLVIAVFVVRRKLQIVVQEQAQVVAPAGDDNTLIGRRLGMDDFVGIHMRFGHAR
ncbi:hypothetical protein SDC9_181568 [bioreactor metagenome]|uniref:Uncharacterized protein n=1 Tax=bioreactor metagenome TaxID=1076179 RepID=A0A645H6F3_9ZZZZ